MITPAEIKKKAKNLYPEFIKDWLAGRTNFPRRIPADLKHSDDLLTAKREINTLREGSKECRKRGYRVEWVRRKDRLLGENNFPEAIYIDTAEDLVQFVGKKREFATLKRLVQLLRGRRLELDRWLNESNRWKALLACENELHSLLSIVDYLSDHPRPGCYLREIPLPISTKLIKDYRRLLSQWLDIVLPPEAIDRRYTWERFELRYGFKKSPQHVIIRIFDPRFQRELETRFTDLSLPIESINSLEPIDANIVVIENKVNLLTLPPIVAGIALGGLGRAVSVLKDACWLSHSNLFYWGDLDIEGFEILSHFRKSFPNAHSLLMDIDTLHQHAHLTQAWKGKPNRTPLSLTLPEQAAYDHLLQHRLRIEQEHIPQSAVLNAITEAGLRVPADWKHSDVLLMAKREINALREGSKDR